MGNNLNLAYNYIAEMAKDTPYLNDLSYQLNIMSEENEKRFYVLCAIANNMRFAENIMPLDIRDTIEYAKAFNAGLPIISVCDSSVVPLYRVSGVSNIRNTVNLITSSPNKYTHAKFAMGVDEKLAGDAISDQFNLTNGEFKVKPHPKKDINCYVDLANRGKGFIEKNETSILGKIKDKLKIKNRATTNER